jgi:hypothetical protein
MRVVKDASSSDRSSGNPGPNVQKRPAPCGNDLPMYGAALDTDRLFFDRHVDRVCTISGAGSLDVNASSGRFELFKEFPVGTP